MEGLQSITGLLVGHKLSGLSAAASGTDADSYVSKVTGTAVIVDEKGNDVTSQYTVKTEDGELKINPVEIEITAKSDEKPYDGTALTNSGYDITKGSFIGEDGLADVTVEGSQTIVGESDNTITGYELSEGTKSQNYTITTKKGTLKVTDREEGKKFAVTVTAKSL